MLTDLSTCAPAAHQFPKRCSCGRHYSRAGWDALPLVCNRAAPAGRSHGPDSESPGLEWRNCPACHSTLAVELQSYEQRLAEAREALAHAETSCGLRRAS